MFLDFIRVFQVWNTPPPVNVQIQVIEMRADYMPLSLFIRQASKKKEMQVDTEMPSGALQEHSKEASSSPATSGEAQGSFLSEHRAESRNPHPKMTGIGNRDTFQTSSPAHLVASAHQQQSMMCGGCLPLAHGMQHAEGGGLLMDAAHSPKEWA